MVGVQLPEDEDYETIAGLIGDQLARMPAVGDAVTLDAVDDAGAPLAVDAHRDRDGRPARRPGAGSRHRAAETGPTRTRVSTGLAIGISARAAGR